MMTRSRTALLPLALVALAAGCGGETTLDGESGVESSLAAATSYTLTLKTTVGGKFVSAENGGNAALLANRDAAQAWERFTLYDLDGGALSSGDLVALTAAGGQFVCAEGGGGGEVNATRTRALDWENFRVIKVGGSGAIHDGDQIALQTRVRGLYVSAVDGGGGALTADRTSVSGWEAFVAGLSGGSSGGGASGGQCNDAQRSHCNCPSGFFCCPTDGSCFQNAGEVIYTQCKDSPAAVCSMSGTGGGGSTGGGGPIGGGSTPPPAGTTRLRITSNCADPIWVAHSDNVPDAQNVRLAKGESRDYQIPAGGLSAARFWPKTGCDGSGHGCVIGDNGEGGGKPCPATGCQAPLDSKFEATFAPVGAGAQTWYNLSQVDGYTLSFKVKPLGSGAEKGSCISSDCSRLALAGCPGDENLSGNGLYSSYAHEDLRVRDASGKVIACMAPCKKWNYPAPYGLGQAENRDPGLHLCCPTPIDPASGQCTVANGCMTSEACRAPADPLSVVHTSYVAALHSMCPSAYAYSYDDAAGLHACPSDTRFEVTFCP
ncbi:MAG: hypothetical protein JWN44_5459 [Myxococcales bacterium]|nr:hypothetical protein [Myxococcales bacterium]